MDTNPEAYKFYKQAVKDQGRKIMWVAVQLGCSYGHVQKYLNGHKVNGRDVMGQAMVEKLHKVMFGE